MGLAGGLSLAIGLLVIGGLYVWMAKAIEAGDLSRNGAVGLRTSQTMKSDAAWDAGHRAAAPMLRSVGIQSLIITGCLLVWSIGSSDSVALIYVIAMVGYVVVVGGTVWAAVKAHRAAAVVGDSADCHA